MIRRTLTLLALLLIMTTAQAQKINNDLSGYYLAQDETQLYSFFIFDGNGKVDITGMGDGDFFSKDDTLIIFPDKSIFKFKIEKDRITGVSDWVKDGVWIRQDTLTEDKRTNSQLAQQKAVLLNDYYRQTRMGGNDLSLLFDEDAGSRYQKTLEELCSKGLAKACMELFGLRLMNEMGGMGAVLTNTHTTTLKNNPELVALANKVIDMGEPEGHTLLAKYWYALGDKEKAAAEFDAAIAAGSKTAALTQLGLSLEEEAAGMEQPKQTKKKVVK